MKKLITLIVLIAGFVGTANADTKTLYFDGTSVSGENAWFALRALTSDDSEGEWYKFTNISGNLYSVSYDSKYTKLIICRMNPQNQTLLDFNNSWNQTYDLIGAPDDAYFKSGSFESGTKYFVCGPYCVVDDGTFTGNVWKHWKTYMNYDSSTGLLNYASDPTLINKSEFKIRITWGEWWENYGDSNNSDDKNIHITNLDQNDYEYYKFTMTFDPSTGANPNYELSQPVTTNGKGYATFVSTNALLIPNGITAYYATDRGNGSAMAVKMTNPAADTPMLIKGDANKTYDFEVAQTGTDNPGSTNAFKKGPVTGLTSGTGPYNYILNGDAFYAANGKNVAEGKAYLQLSAEASARGALIFDNEEETGINIVTASTGNVDAYYNLNGQRITSPSKGLYIVNGRKVIMK